jgi:hypothetical protein
MEGEFTPGVYVVDDAFGNGRDAHGGRSSVIVNE